MAGEYTEFLRRRMPRWLRGTWGDRWVDAIGGMLDALLGGAKEAAKAHFILECPDDAVSHHARDRAIVEIDGETAATLRARTANAWVTKSEMGPAMGLRDYMREVLNCTGLEVYDIAFHGWLDGSQGPDNLEDYNGDNGSRLWVVIPQPHRWTVPVCGPELVCGPDMICGITMTRSELSLLRRLAREERPAHIDPVEAYVLFDATTAAAVLADHQASASYIRLPLYQVHVNYPNGRVCGTDFICGQRFY